MTIAFLNYANETRRSNASLCLWEIMVEERRIFHKQKSTIKKPIPFKTMHRMWDEYGTDVMREQANSLGPYICQTYDALPDYAKEMLTPFDYQFVPDLLSLINWKTVFKSDVYTPPVTTWVDRLGTWAGVLGQDDDITRPMIGS